MRGFYRTWRAAFFSVASAPPYPGNRLTLFPFSFLAAPQCWRGFLRGCDGRRRQGQPRFGRFSVLCSRTFSVSATDAAAPEPAMTRVYGSLFVTEAAAALETLCKPVVRF